MFLRRILSTSLGILTILFLVSCDSSGETGVLRFDSTAGKSSPEVAVEVVRTERTREVGLMYRKSMADKSGMLFVFQDEVPRGFWMKNTYLPLDMVFVNGAFKVVKIIANATPLTETLRLSEAPAKYVVELNAGKAGEWGVTEGSSLVFVTKIPPE